MPLRFFWIPALNGDEAGEELNHFLRSHRVLSVARRWVEQGESSAWAICVDYVEKADAPRGVRLGPAPSFLKSNGMGTGAGPKIDYRETLKPDEFEVFRRLRNWRSDRAVDEKIAPYLVFKDEHLAEIVRSRAKSKTALGKVAGIGPAKLEKYGDILLKVIEDGWSAAERLTAAEVSANSTSTTNGIETDGTVAVAVAGESGPPFERIIDRDNLRWAAGKALIGKRDRKEAREFTASLETNLSEMARGLEDATYPVGRCRQFVIYDPKERLITAPCFAERVLHHAMIRRAEALTAFTKTPGLRSWRFRDQVRSYAVG